LKTRIAAALQNLSVLAGHYRVGIVVFGVAVLGGFGITAVAVAPMVPDASDLPQRLVVDQIEAPGLDSQLLALSQQQLTLTRSEVTRGTDTAQSLLARLGVQDAAAAQFIRTDSTARVLVTGRGGKLVRVQTGADGSLLDLTASFPSAVEGEAKTHFTRMTVSKVADKWLARLQTIPYGGQLRLASGTIRSSLFAATDDAGIPDAVAAQLAEIFSTDIDMHRQLRKGDSFSAVYEVLTADGEPVPWNEGVGRVTAAEFVNAGKSHHAVWFEQAGQSGAYFDLQGRSKRSAFLASPMEFSRVTSGFAMRFHPLLNTWRRHLGVDYAAPVGTPVRTVGDGVVAFAGTQNGYGKVVEIQHSNERRTLYAHLSQINVRQGQRVEQGERVGAVGMTGWTTGPHLHFEFRIKGEHQDPLLVAKAADTTHLNQAEKPRFLQDAERVQVKLGLAESLVNAKPRFE